MKVNRSHRNLTWHRIPVMYALKHGKGHDACSYFAVTSSAELASETAGACILQKET